MGMSIDLTKKVYIFFNKDAKYAKNINTDAKKIKNKERRKKAEEAVYTVLDLSEWW